MAAGSTFWVEDEGVAAPGIEDARLFEQFRRVERRSRSQRKRSRLGLFIVRSIVERHGGTRALERTAQGTHARNRRAAAGGAGMKILLVDDDPDLLSVTGFALQQAGFLVVKAGGRRGRARGVRTRAARISPCSTSTCRA